MRVFCVLAAALLAACSEPSDLGPPPPPASSLASTSASAGTASTSGGGGSGGAGGAGEGGGAEGPVDAGPADPPCAGDVAFWASGMAFVAPTPQPLAQALSELAYDPLARPISVVLAGAKMGVSATQEGDSGLAVFPPGEVPELVPALISFGGLETGAPQAVGHLHLVDSAGPLSIELTGIGLKASTMSGCSTMVATLTAIIPASEGSKTLHLKAGASTIAELGGGDGGGPKDAGPQAWEIRALFSGETMAFDFTTLK